MPFRTKKTNIWQYDIFVGGCRFRGSCRTKDWEEAKNVEAQIRAEAKSKAARGARYTLSETLGTYYNDVSQHQPSARTTKSQASVLLQHFGPKTIADTLTNAQIAGFVAKQRSSCANATVNRRLALLGRALKYMAETYKATTPDLALQNAKVKEPKERVRELSQDEQAKLFKTLPQEYQPFVSFALMTGARIATICGLEWDDVDLPNRELMFRLKGDDAMVFPINTEIAALLSALPRSNLLSQRRYVFTRVDKQTAERVQIRPDGGTFGVAFRQALEDASINNFRFHDLRHTFCTRMLRRTGNLKLVSKLAGHKSIETTMRYAHVMMDDMRTAVDDYSVFGSSPKTVVSQKKPQTK